MTRIVVAGFFLALVGQGQTFAADYPLAHRRVVRAVEVRLTDACYEGRGAFVRYAPVLATQYWVKPVYIEHRVPCRP